MPVLAAPFVAWPLVAMTFSSPASVAAGVAATAVAFAASESGDWASEAGGGLASEVSVFAPTALSERDAGVVELSAAGRASGAGVEVNAAMPAANGLAEGAGASGPSATADRSISPSPTLSSVSRNRDPSHRKM